MAENIELSCWQETLNETYNLRGKCYQKILKFEEAVKDFSSLI